MAQTITVSTTNVSWKRQTHARVGRQRTRFRLHGCMAWVEYAMYAPQNADKISPDKKVVLHCRSGQRSADAIVLLEEKYGLQNLYNLKGGILAYANEVDTSLARYW